MFYQERGAAPELLHHAFSYWELGALQAEPFVHRVFPDGCFGLVYRRNQRRGTSELQIAGGRLQSLDVHMGDGDRFWGVRLAPAACAALLGREPASLREARYDSPPSGRESETLLRKLDAADNLPEAMIAFDDYLLAQKVRLAQVDLAIETAVQLIDHSAGQLTIPRVAVASGLSVRQLQRRFLAATGFTPKQFARTRRLRAVAVGLDPSAPQRAASWSSRAAELGFADQAHLTRELVSLTGRAPVRFASDIALIEHGHVLR